MKIVYVITRADAVGGASIHVRDMATSVRAAGHEALVLVGGVGPVTEQLSAAKVPFRALDHLRRAINPARDWAAYAELKSALAELKPDLVSTHTAKAGWLGRAAASSLGLPVIYTPHGWPVARRVGAAHGTLFTLAERVASRWNGAVVCVCEAERRLALDARLARPEHLHVIHNGVRDVPPEFRASPGIDPVRLCTVARFEAPKDHATLLVALAAIREWDWRLDLVGDGPLEARARRLAASLGISERVRFRGYLAEPEPVLAASQIFVLATRSEAFPRSVLEAMRAGLPVVASDVGGVSEAVEAGVTGLLAPPGDASALSRAIATLVADAVVRRRFGDHARAAYERRFRLEHTVAATLALYREIMNP